MNVVQHRLVGCFGTAVMSATVILYTVTHNLLLVLWPCQIVSLVPGMLYTWARLRGLEGG